MQQHVMLPRCQVNAAAAGAAAAAAGMNLSLCCATGMMPAMNASLLPKHHQGQVQPLFSHTTLKHCNAVYKGMLSAIVAHLDNLFVPSRTCRACISHRWP